jgi:FMN phosphatase YigB (HAD superfamily)
MGEPRLLLVDLGGVFFDYDFGRAIEHWAAAADTDPRLLKQRFTIDAPFDAFERGEISPADYLTHLRTVLQVNLTDDQFAAGWSSIYGSVNHVLVALLRRLDPQVLVPVGVSNTNVLHAARWRQLYRDELTVFGQVYCSHDLRITKPEPAFFDRIAAAHRLPRSALVVLDDQPAVITAATALGMPAHLYRTPADTAAYLDRLTAPLSRHEHKDIC